MIDTILKIFGYKRIFTEEDDMYRSIRLKDYGMDNLKGISDNKLKRIWHYSPYEEENEHLNINPLAYEKFWMKHAWHELKQTHNYLCYSFSLSAGGLLIFLVYPGIWSFLPPVFFGLLYYYFRRRMKTARLQYRIDKFLSDFFTNDNTKWSDYERV